MKKPITEIIIVVLLWINIAISIFRHPKFSVEFIFGLISLAIISAALLLRKRDLSLGLLVFVLILSSFNVIKFNESFYMKVGFVHTIPFVLMIILSYFRRKELIMLWEKWFGIEPVETAKAQENKVAFFKREFQNLSSEELIRRMNNDKLVEEARIAIDQLLKERDMTMTGFMN